MSEQRSQEAAEPIFVGLAPSQVADRDDGALRATVIASSRLSLMTSRWDKVLYLSLEINHHIPEAKGS